MEMREVYLVKSLAVTFELKWLKLLWHFEDGLERTNSIPNNIWVWICIFGATCHQAKSSKPVYKCDSRYEECVV